MLTQLLYDNAASRPGDTAIVYRDERIGHADPLERIERLAGGLAEKGDRPGRRRRARAREPGLRRGLYAITRLGEAVAPLNPAFKREELV